jgi:hypothetical protein
MQASSLLVISAGKMPFDETGSRLRKRYGVPRDACVTRHCRRASGNVNISNVSSV